MRWTTTSRVADDDELLGESGEPNIRQLEPDVELAIASSKGSNEPHSQAGLEFTNSCS